MPENFLLTNGRSAFYSVYMHSVDTHFSFPGRLRAGPEENEDRTVGTMAEIRKSPCYCTNLRRGARAASEFYDRKLRAAGINVAQYSLLKNLSRLGSANISDWAACVGLERSTMVRNVRVLETRGLIARTAGRGKTYTLSGSGKQTLEAAAPLWEDAQAEIRAYLGERDAAALLRMGEKFRQLLAAEGRTGGPA